MLTIKRTDSADEDFDSLRRPLDAYLADLDGDEHAFYAQFNKSSLLKNALVCYYNDLPIAIGAYKEYDPATIEVKRMFTLPAYRGKGAAKTVLNELEKWAKEEGYTTAILETGHKQLDAIGLYRKMGYMVTDNFGQYIGVANSVCMKKQLNNYLEENGKL